MKSALCSCLILLFLVSPADGSERCPPPPVTTAEQAVCLARVDLERERPNTDWKALKPTAIKEDGSGSSSLWIPPPACLGVAARVEARPQIRASKRGTLEN